MGGELTVEPRPDGGVPLRCIDLAACAAEGQPLASLAGRRLLVVMPDGAEPAVVARSLTHAGADARVVATVNAAAALAGAAAAAALPYDVVLVDRRIAAEPEAALLRLREAAGVPARLRHADRGGGTQWRR